MDRAHFKQPQKYWLARASLGCGPALRLIRRVQASGPPKPPSEWREVVLLGADHIGDVLYRTVGLAEFRHALPDCRLHFAASRPAADVLAGHPSLDSVILATEPVERRTLRERVRLLRARPFDAAICYNPSDYWRDHLAVALAGIPNCVGYTHKGFPGMVTHAVPFRFPQPYAAYFRDLVQDLTGATVPSLRPVVFTGEADRKNARELRAAIGRPESPLVVASITSRQVSHGAIQRRMLEVLREFQRREDLVVVLVGAREDAVLLRDQASEAGLDCFHAAGRLTLSETVAFFELAAAAFCLDSGPRHLANAAGCRVVFCRNLEFLKVEAGRYLDTETDIAPDAEGLSYSSGQEPPLFSVEAGVEALRDAVRSATR